MKAVRLLFLIVWSVFFTGSVLASGAYLAVPLQDPLWYVHCAQSPHYQLIDFSQFYQAGQLALSSDAHRVYDPGVQNAWAAKLIAPCVPDKIFYNQSVPFLYILTIPFGFLPYNFAYLAWTISTMLLALAALYWLIQRVAFLRGWGRLIFLSGVIASTPFYLTIWHGQSTFLLTAALAGFALFIMQKRNIAAGFCLALSTFKPQYMLPFVALALGMQRRSIVFALCLGETLLMAAAAAFIGAQNILNYPRVLAGAESSSHFVGVNPQIMASLRGLLSALVPHQTAMIVAIILLIVSLLPLGLAAGRLIKQTAASPTYLEMSRWLIALTFVQALIFSPHTHYFDCLLLAVPAALTLPTVDLAALLFKSGPLVQGLSLPHRMWCIVLLLFPLISWPFNFYAAAILPAALFPFAADPRVAEGMLFLSINILLAALAIAQLRHLSSNIQAPIFGDDLWKS